MPPSTDEFARLSILEAHDTADLENDPSLNAITSFASGLCGAPISVVSLVEADRQRFVSRNGLEASGTPRTSSFCAHAMLDDRIMVVPDAKLDPRFADNPLVTSDPFIRFYAGAALISEEGAPLGALCIIDHHPRTGLTALQAAGLRLLADQVMLHLDARRVRRARSESERVAERAISEQEQRFRVLADTMPQMVWSTLPDGYHDYYNARWYEFTGVPVGSTDGEGWNGMFHPSDQARAWERWRRSLATGEPYEIEYRLRDAAGEYRWTLGRALPIRDEEGRITRWFGTCTDIHEQKLLAEQQEIVSHELSHRIKNIFSIIAGMISLSARRDPAWTAPAADLRERVIALGRAHDFVRPHSAASRNHARRTSLQGMLTSIFEPYGVATEARVSLLGDDPDIDDRSATPLALIFHELATNAAKYGALSVEHGRVVVEISRQGGAARMTWSEQGGPRLSGAPPQTGFGTQLLDLSAVRQLGADLVREWRPEGLRVDLTVPTSALARAEVMPQRA